MKKIQFIFLFLIHFFSRYFSRKSISLNGEYRRSFKNPDPKIIFAGLILLVAFFIFFKFSPDLFPRPDLTLGVIGPYSYASFPGPVANLISKPLVILDKDGRPKPELSSGWQVNNDSTLYTFKLKNGLVWNDGSTVKASDIKFNIPDVDVRYPDDETIEFKLTDSFSPFPSLLTSPVFKANTLIGMGNYKVIKEDREQRKLILKYMGENFPIISVSFFPDERTAKTAFELGEVEGLIGTSEGYQVLGESVEQKKVRVLNKFVAVFYNTKDPVLADKNLRKALSAASPKIEGEEIARTPLPENSWSFNSDIKEVLDDPESAKSYLSKVPTALNAPITLTTIPALSDVGEKIIKSWKQNGIEAVLRVESGIPQNFQALLLSESIPQDPDQYALWHSTQTLTNLSKYSSPRIDKDLEDGRKTGDFEKRREKYMDFQRILLEDSPATFLYFPKTQILFRKKAESNLNKLLPLMFPNN